MITSEQRFKLKKFIEHLSKYKARHTELVSVYIPSGYDINKRIQQLLQEQGTATNIKSATTRKNVIDALERMIQHLRLYKQTPSNGLAVFSGNISGVEGKSDVEVWSIEPPVPLNIGMYRCDKQFILDPLQEMVEEKTSYGLLVMDRKEATIAELKGKRIIPLLKLKSAVPGKFKAGGQSAARFARVREGAAKDFYKKVADSMKAQFEGKDIKGIIVGGPGNTKKEFADGDFLITDLKNKIISLKDLTYTNEFGLQVLVNKSEDVLAQEDIVEEKKAMSQFLNLLAVEPGKVAYGITEVRKYLEQGVVDQLLLSESLEENLLNKLDDVAQQFSTSVHIISTETPEGVQLKNLGGVAAILRYNTQG